MFATNDFSRFTFMDKSKFIPHVEISIHLQIANHRSSITPDEPGTSQVINRISNSFEPLIALTSYAVDTISVGNSLSNHLELLTGSFGGVGVHIRNSATLSDDTCYTPLGVCSAGAIQS